MLNLTATYCLLSKTPAGSLRIAGSVSGAFSPTGAILPFLGPEAEYYGPVTPALSGQIVQSSGVTGSLSAPTPLLNPQLYTLGFGLDEQDASVVSSGSNNNLDSLGFYLTTTPAAGTRIRFRSNESQRSISHVIDSDKVAIEAELVGDDGHRTAVVSDMSPLPRTSEDCDAAAQAYIYDRSTTLYNGTYTAESDLNQNDTADDDGEPTFIYHPIAGLFLKVNCPARNLDNLNFLVTQVATTVLDARSELLSYALTFGADTRTEKLLANFVTQEPSNVFTPQDSANVPTGQTLAQIVTGSYLPDLQDVEVDYIVDTNVAVTINSPGLTMNQPLAIIAATNRIVGGASVPRLSASLPSLDTAIASIGPGTVSVSNPTPDQLAGETVVEVRLSDQNWGQNSANLVARYSVSNFPLTKNNYDQTWYMRLVQFDANGQPYMISRRSKVIRVKYPLRPAAPNIVYATTVDMQLDFNGDQRNIYGIEIRTGDDQTVMFQQSANDTNDLYFNLQTLANDLAALNITQSAIFSRGYTARFFNAQWLYSTPTAISISLPPAPILEVGVRFSQMLQIISDVITSRDDIAYQVLEVSYNNFATGSLPLTIKSTGQPGTWSVSVPSTSDVWVRSKRADFLGEGPYSAVLHIPQGDLIASDYLTTQASIPPIVTDNVSALFSYTSTESQISIMGLQYSITFPNQQSVLIPPVTGVFTLSYDGLGNTSALTPGTTYSYFPRVDSPMSADAHTDLGNLYSGVTSNFYQTLIQDGVALLTAGAPLSVMTAATPTGSAGGSSGGGTAGGGGDPSVCISEDDYVQLIDGSMVQAKHLVPSHLLKSPNGATGRIKHLKMVADQQMYEVVTATRSLRCTAGHALKINGRWAPCEEIAERLAEGEDCNIHTVDGTEKLVSITPHHKGMIVAIKMLGRNKVYYANGFESHNYMFKGDPDYAGNGV